MRQSKLFTKTRKESPKDEVSKNADLLIRAGFIHKEMAGVYSLLPLGLKTMNKIEEIVRDEMNKIDGQEVSLAALQEKELWEKTNRWDDVVVDNWFKTKLKNETELGLAFTHEEPITRLMKDHILSYNNLPKYAYQFQTKFRNETRAKSGILRGREFLMKDLYSFSKDEAQHNEFYEKASDAYKNIFDRVGIGHLTYKTFASGGVFAEFSHEFQTVTDAGEDLIYIDEESGMAVNKEVLTDEVLNKLKLSRDKLVEKKSIEVGNIFSLGTKFSEPLELIFTDEKGNRVPVIMGCYGIGIGRLMGTVVEVLSDDKGIVWPKSVSPFDLHLICLNTDNAEVLDEANKIYESLNKNGFSVLFDDRDKQAGEKFADSDLIGIPTRIIVSKKTLVSGAHEVVDRSSQEVSEFSTSAIVSGAFLK
ncbi:MAG: aminoacyl--tRNA ligase-related protein [Candidatus Paceibacterota bacterium]